MNMPEKKLLLISNSRKYGCQYLEHVEGAIKDFLNTQVKKALFIPFAGITISFENFAQMTAERFRSMGYDMESIHESSDPQRACAEAEAIVIGGGNTFQLLKKLQEADLISPIRQAVDSGTLLIGWSAGATICGLTIQTTNDMPVAWPKVPDALALVPFQINPHYTDEVPPGFSGESREKRIAEFISLHRKVYVVGLRENTMLEIRGQSVRLLGPHPTKVFFYGKPPEEYTSAQSLDFLMPK